MYIFHMVELKTDIVLSPLLYNIVYSILGIVKKLKKQIKTSYANCDNAYKVNTTRWIIFIQNRPTLIKS